MIKNYFKIAFRQLLRNKGYTAINIFGLAIGLASFLLISLYVIDEWSYDRYNKKADRIYRINADIRFGGTDMRLTVSSDPMGPTLKKDYPQVEEYVRIYASGGTKLIRKGNEFIDEANVAHADSTLFDVFTLPAVSGDAKTALNEPNTVVITESTAKKYFGSTDAIGKTIETRDRNTELYKVTAVIKDIPHSSHFNFDFIFSMDNVDYDFGNYLSNNFQTYLLLKPGTDYKEFEKNFTQVINKYVLPQASQFMEIKSMDDFEKAGNKLVYSLMPLTDIHLYSDRNPELGVNGNIQYVYIFSAVALFLLLIACINFMNLSTARSANRGKEVGIRKVLGTGKKSLITQFLTESTLMVFISLLIALVIAWLVLPMFNDISAKSLSISSLLGFKVLPLLLLFTLLIGLLAGGYPAFILSKFRPIAVLKGNNTTGMKKSNLRNVLVVFQFFTSIVLIIGTVVVFRQLDFIQTKKLGFKKEQVLVINGTGALDQNKDAFKNEVLKMEGVTGGTYSSYLPVSSSSRNDITFSKEAVMDSKAGLNAQNWRVDYDYFNILGMEFSKGRAFSKDFGGDSSTVVINESFAYLLGYDDPLGKTLYIPTDMQSGEMEVYTIIGVLKNFHFESLRRPIGPVCFRLGRSTGLASFKVSTGNVKNLVSNIEGKWKTMAAGMPFSYRFLDEAFDQMYRTEQRTGKVAMIFSILAILIACMGLFGLATYMAEQRTKEIGIRKVLGATVPNLVTLLSKGFLRLVLIAFVIAVPVSWWAMSKWLQDFSYRVNIGWWVFIAAGAVAILIALVTVSYQAIKAAVANPVKSLRTE